MVAGNGLDARTRNLGGHFIFEVGAYLQVLSDADNQNFVEPLSFVIWVEPTRDHLDGLAVNGSENRQRVKSGNVISDILSVFAVSAIWRKKFEDLTMLQSPIQR